MHYSQCRVLFIYVIHTCNSLIKIAIKYPHYLNNSNKNLSNSIISFVLIGNELSCFKTHHNHYLIKKFEMINYNDIQTYPELSEILRHIDEKLESATCPPEQEIWDNKRLCKELNISVRTSAYLRSKKILPYHKVEGLLYYLKSDVLGMLKRNRIESIGNKSRIKTK